MRRKNGNEVKIHISVDKSLKNKFAAWCKKNGISMAAAIRLLIRDVVNGKIELGFRPSENIEKKE